MPKADPIAILIPWYVNGTLDPAEREQVESHLPECPTCYALLAQARSFRRQAPGTRDEALYDHVEGHLLVQFAEQPERLEADARHFISTHISECTTCADALEIVQDLSLAPIDAGDEAGAAPTPRGPWAALIDAAVAFWRGLSRTMLRPVPALIYLGALLLVLTIVPLRRPGGEAGGPAGMAPVAVTALPPAVRLPEELVMRGEESVTAPQSITVPADEGPIAVELITSIDLPDLADAGAAFSLDILAGERVVHHARLRGADFDRRGRLSLLLDPRAFAIGETYTVRLQLEKDGDHRHGETLYRRSFTLGRADTR